MLSGQMGQPVECFRFRRLESALRVLPTRFSGGGPFLKIGHWTATLSWICIVWKGGCIVLSLFVGCWPEFFWVLCGRVGSNARALLYGLDVCAAPLLFKGVGCCRLHLWCELHLSYLKESGVAVHKFLQMRSRVEDVYILVEMKCSIYKRSDGWSR